MRRCKAKARSGVRCKRAPALGQAVCYYHGAASPQAKASAAQRLAALADPAVAELSKLMKRARPDAAKLAAVNSILDRTGHVKTAAVQVSGVEGLAGVLRSLSPVELAELARLTEEES